MAQQDQLRDTKRHVYEIGTQARYLRVETGGEGKDTIISVIDASGKSETVVLNFAVPYDKYRSFAGRLQVRPPGSRGKKQEG